MRKAAIGKLARKLVYGVHSDSSNRCLRIRTRTRLECELRMRNRLPERAIETVIQKTERQRRIPNSSRRFRHA